MNGTQKTTDRNTKIALLWQSLENAGTYRYAENWEQLLYHLDEARLLTQSLEREYRLETNRLAEKL